MNAIALKIPRLTATKFVELCHVNQNLRLEMTATGEVIIMPPTYFLDGKAKLRSDGSTLELERSYQFRHCV